MAGYAQDEATKIRQEVEYFEKLREEIKLASGDYVDMKMYEPAMRHLLDTYIRADETEKLSAFDDMTLVDLIVQRGEDAVKELPEAISSDPEAVSETIENNVRRLIVDEMPVNPKYYEKMSELLGELIRQRRQEAMDYKEYLRRIIELTKKVASKGNATEYPTGIDTSALRALYDNLNQNTTLAVRLDEKIRAVKKAGWRGNRFKEKEVKLAIQNVLSEQQREAGGFDPDAVFELVRNQNDY